MCASDIYRVKRMPAAAQKKQAKPQKRVEDEFDVESLCANAHLAEAVDYLNQ
jgi:hypothetical protein